MRCIAANLFKNRKFISNSLPLMVLVLIFVGLLGCSKKTIQTVYPTLSDGRYDSEFPYRNCSEELDKISKTVKKLYCLVEYDQYFFNRENQINEDFLIDNRFKRLAFQKSFFSESVHGTATIVYRDDQRVAVLTCAHVIDYPDTIYNWFYDGLGNKTNDLESISIKRKQQNFIRDFPGDGVLEIIAMDNKKDIAFLGNTFDELGGDIQTFKYPMGEAGKLEWGSFVYILGFPSGHQMVTRGIVSNPNPGSKGEFLIDALFNPGVSGGIVLAVKDGVPNFEMVGIARAVSAKYKNVIKPGKESHQEIYNPNTPYDGDVFVKLEKEIYYGVTFTIAIESIIEFYSEHRESFVSRGYRLDNFFGLK